MKNCLQAESSYARRTAGIPLIGGDHRRAEISLCDHYDSRGLSDLCRRGHSHRCETALIRRAKPLHGIIGST